MVYISFTCDGNREHFFLLEDMVTMGLIIDLVVGSFLGVSLAAPPGPVTSMILRKSTSSVMSGLFVGFGAMTADLIMMILSILFEREFDLIRFEFYFLISGAAFIFIMAYFVGKSLGESVEEDLSGSYRKGFLVGIGNPFQIIWWLTSGIAFYLHFGIGVFYFIFLGTTGWVLFLSYVTFRTSRAYGEKTVRAASLLSLTILLLFGFYLLYEAVSIL